MATECQIGFATLKTQFINQFINHRRFLAILCLVCLEMNVQAKQCALLWTFISKEKFKSDGYSYTHWWIDPSNLFSKTSSWVVLFQVLLDVNSWIFETDARLGLVWTLLIRWWKWSWVPEFWNLRITSTTTRAVFFFDSDSSQMLFNPYTCCWGINTPVLDYIPCSFRG